MKLNKLKFLGVMIFITLLLDVIPSSGFVEIGSISITTMHIPVILTAVVLGPWYGAILGALFGIISLLHAITREAAPLDGLFINPVISVLPRVCIALVSGYLYQFLGRYMRENFKPLPVAVSALAGTLTNTVLVLGALYFLCPDQMVSIFELSDRSYLFSTLVDKFKLNSLIEAALSMITAIPCVYVCCMVSERNSR